MSLPGLDATHVWNNAITLRGDSDAVLTPPYYLIRKIDGWRSLPDTEDSAELAHGRPGEIPRSTRRAGKSVAYECVCVGRTPTEMHDGIDNLLAAFQDAGPDGEMTVTPFTASFGADSYFYRARALALASDEEWIAGPHHTRSGGWERAFVLSLRMHDPRFYRSTIASTESSTSWYDETHLINRVTNPNCVGTTGWYPVTGTVAAVTGGAYHGTANVRHTVNTASTSSRLYSNQFAVLPGETIGLRMAVLRETTAGTLQIQPSIRFYTAAGATVSTIYGTLVQPAVNTWQEVTFTGAVPADVDFAAVGIQNSLTTSATHRSRIDSVTVVRNPTGLVAPGHLLVGVTSGATFIGTINNAQSTTIPHWSWITYASGYDSRYRTAVVTNTGTADAEPIIEFYGACTGPRIYNELTKTGIRFDSNLVLGANDYLRINFATRAVQLNGSIDYDRYRVADYSNWWDDGVAGLVRGQTQTIRFGARVIPAGSNMRIVARYYPTRY